MANQKEKSSEKKTWKIVILATSLVTTLLLIVAFLLALTAFDPFIYSQEYRGLSAEEIYEEEVVMSTYETSSTKKISYKVGMFELNELANIAYNENTASLAGQVTNFYLEETKEGYDFVFEFALLKNTFLRSRLVLHTLLTSDETSYIFNIKSMKVGKYNVTNIVKRNKLLTDYLLNRMFKSMNLSVVSELGNNRFIYSFKDVLSDYYSHIDIEDEFYKSIYDSFNFGIKNPFLIEADSSSFTANETYINLSRSKMDINLGNYKRGAVYVLQQDKNNKYIASDIYKYLLKGYDSLSDKEKNNIDNLDFTSFHISDNKAYQGIQIPYENTDTVEYIVQSGCDSIDISEVIPGDTYNLASINENDLTKLLRTSTTLFKSRVNSCNTYLSTFTISDIYTEIVNGHIYVNYVIDIDGLETYLTFDFASSNATSYQYSLLYDLSGVYFGKELVSEELKKQSIALLKETLSSSAKSNFITFDDTSKTLSLNFNSYVEASSNGIYFFDFGKGSVTSLGSSLSEEGKLNLTFRAL